MKHSTLSLSTLALCAATGAGAQSLDYVNVSGYFASVDSGILTEDVIGVNAGFETNVGDFILNGSMSLVKIETGPEITQYSLGAGYQVSPDLIVFGTALKGEGAFEDVTSFGLGAEYGFDGVTVGVNYQSFSADSGDYDLRSLYGSYQVSDELEVGLVFDNDDLGTVTTFALDYDSEQINVNAIYSVFEGEFMFSIRGDYEFANGMRAGAGYGSADGFITSLSVHGGYEIQEDLWVDLIAERVEGMYAPELNSIALMLTYETGNQALLRDRLLATQSDSMAPLMSTIFMSF